MDRKHEQKDQLKCLNIEASQRITQIHQLWRNWLTDETLDSKKAFQQASQLEMRLPDGIWELDPNIATGLAKNLFEHFPLVFAMTQAIQEIEQKGLNVENRYVRAAHFYKYLTDGCLDENGILREPTLPADINPDTSHPYAPEP